MLNFDLIKNILIVALASSIITTATVQKIKEYRKSKKYLGIISLSVSMIIGTLFAFCFSSLSFVNDLWAGFVTFLGADMIYKAFEDKIFKSFSDLQNKITLERTNK